MLCTIQYTLLYWTKFGQFWPIIGLVWAKFGQNREIFRENAHFSSRNVSVPISRFSISRREMCISITEAFFHFLKWVKSKVVTISEVHKWIFWKDNLYLGHSKAHWWISGSMWALGSVRIAKYVIYKYYRPFVFKPR